MGPWTGRSADVSVVLDLMIHDLDLVHQWFRGGGRPTSMRARRALHGSLADEVIGDRRASPMARWRIWRPAASPTTRRRGMRAVNTGRRDRDRFPHPQDPQHHAAPAEAAGDGRSAGRVRRGLRPCRCAHGARPAGPPAGSAPRAGNRADDRRCRRTHRAATPVRAGRHTQRSPPPADQPFAGRPIERAKHRA